MAAIVRRHTWFCQMRFMPGKPRRLHPPASAPDTVKKPGHCGEGIARRGNPFSKNIAIIPKLQRRRNILDVGFDLHKIRIGRLCLNKFRRVLLVTTAYHMRRSLAIARYLLPKHIAVIPCPANDSNTKRDNWMNTPVGVERAKSEAMKIVSSVINGIIPDFEI